jgi:hypothetical protein
MIFHKTKNLANGIDPFADWSARDYVLERIRRIPGGCRTLQTPPKF